MNFYPIRKLSFSCSSHFQHNMLLVSSSLRVGAQLVLNIYLVYGQLVFNRILEQITGYLFIRFFPFAYERINPNLLPGYLFGFQWATIKEAMRGGRVAKMSAPSILHCDWSTWRWSARSTNHSAESSGPTFRLLFLLSRSP